MNLPTAYPIIPEASANELKKHIADHEWSIRHQSYDPVKNPRLAQPLHIHSAFRPSLFGEGLFMDMLQNIAKGNHKESGILRFYIDGKLSPEHENRILHADHSSISSLQAYLSEIAKALPFGLVINGVERWSESLAHFAAHYFSDIKNLMGENRTIIETTLFTGDYGFTPFGVHIDDPYTTVVHFHLGPAAKKITLFSKEDFFNLCGNQNNNFNPGKLVRHGITYTVEPGDIFILPPHYYHVGYTPEFSTGVAIAISKYSKTMMNRLVLQQAGNNISKQLDQMDSHHLASISLGKWINESTQLYLAELHSKANLRHGYLKKSCASLLTDTQWILNPKFPIQTISKPDEILIFGRGNKIKLANQPSIQKLINSFSDQATTLRHLHSAANGAVSQAAVALLIQQFEYYGLIVRL